jgi:3-dehydroquinate dehydratase-1
LPKICASIAADNVEDLKKQIHEAFALKADYVEVRFDFLKSTEIQEALKIAAKVRKKAIFTLRSAEQQGKFKGSNQERVAYLKNLSTFKPMLLDVELHTIRDNIDLATYFKNNHTQILISWHDFNETPQLSILLDLLEEMKIYSNFIKIVTTAKDAQDALRLLDFYDYVSGLNLIAFAMGEPGIISRILCTIYGNAPFTYATLEKPLFSGQLTINRMRKIYDRIDTLSDGIYARPS